mgnify:FL=1
MTDKQNVRVDMIITSESATGKAWLVQVTGGPTLTTGKQWEPLWIPKSSVVETDCLAEGDEGYMVLEHWLAESNGLVDDEVDVDHDVSGWQEDAIIQRRLQQRMELKPRRVAGLEGQQEDLRQQEDLQEDLQEGRMSVSIDLDISALPKPQGDMHISAYLTDEGLVVDVFHGEGTEALVTGYEFFSHAGLYPPQSITEDENEH